MSDIESTPQTIGDNPLSEEFQAWLAEQRELEAEQIRSQVAGVISPGDPAPDVETRPTARGRAARTTSARMAWDLESPEPLPTGGSSGGSGGVSPAVPLASFYAYANTRPGKDWNTCGQAAIASMVDFHGRDLGLPRKSDGHWDHGDAIDKVSAQGFAPDVVFGWGTSPGRVGAALNHFGVPAESRHSGLFFSGWTSEWNRLLAYVYYSAIPVPVLVDMGVLGGSAFGAHWPILWKMDYSSTGMRMHLANWSWTWHSLPVPADKFLEAWACRHLPYGFNHAAVYTGRPKVSF